VEEPKVKISQELPGDENTKQLQKKLSIMVLQLEDLRDYTRLSAKNVGKTIVLGACGAFGATVGFALLIALISGIIRELGGLPVVGAWIIQVGQNIHQ
jgi:hypothetical protein